MIECLVEPMILRLHAMTRHPPRQRRVVENGREVDTPSLPVIDGGLYVEHVYAPDHLVELAETEFGHILPHLLRHKKEVIDHVFGFARELLAQFWILRRNAHRAC